MRIFLGECEIRAGFSGGIFATRWSALLRPVNAAVGAADLRQQLGQCVFTHSLHSRRTPSTLGGRKSADTLSLEPLFSATCWERQGDWAESAGQGRLGGLNGAGRKKGVAVWREFCF